MNANRLAKLVKRLGHRNLPFSDRFRRNAAFVLARDGSRDAIQAVVEALVAGKEPGDQQLFVSALEEISTQTGVDAVCEVWMRTRNTSLAELLRRRRWVASASLRDSYFGRIPSSARVLTCLHCSREEDLLPGDPECVQPLLQACEDKNTIIAQAAASCLAKLTSSDAQEEVCQICIRGRMYPPEVGPPGQASWSRRAIQLAVAQAWRPRNACDHVLFYFLTSQWRPYEDLDPQGSLLRDDYLAADDDLRERIREHAKTVGRLPWIEVTANDHLRNLAEVGDNAREAVLPILIKDRCAKEILGLALRAPPKWSRDLVLGLVERSWRPEDEVDKFTFHELSKLALQWNGEIPNADVLCALKTLELDGGGVRCLCFSYDGALLVTASSEKVQVWEVPTLKHLTTLPVRADCLAISQDCALLTTASSETVQQWTLPEGREISQMEAPGEKTHPLIFDGQVKMHYPNQVALNQDGRVLARLTPENVRFWSLAGLRAFASFSASNINKFAFTHDGQLFAAAYVGAAGRYERTISIWSVPQGQVVKTTASWGDEMTCLAISPDGRLLAMGEGPSSLWSYKRPPDYYKVFLVSVTENRLKWKLSCHESPLRSVTFSSDGRFLVTTSDKVRLWHLPEARLLAAFPGGGRESRSVLSPDNLLLVNSAGDNKISVWDLRSLYSALGLMPDNAPKSLQRFECLLQTIAEGNPDRPFLEFSTALYRKRM